MRVTLGQLTAVRSQRAEGIEAYYRSMLNRLDRTPWYRAGRMIPASAVAIPVQVLKEVTRPAPERRPGPGRDQEREERDDPSDKRRIDPEVAALYAQLVLETRQEEVPWETERQTLRRAVILGGPGGGKTFLTLTTALAMARQGLDELERRTKPLEELPLPVWLELDTLGQAHWPQDLSEALVAMLRQQYPMSTHLERWLGEVLRTPNCWLILDALDQVRAENLERLRERLEGLESWPCKVVLTCRTANYDRTRIPWGELTEYELALFGFTEIEALIDRWYGVADPKGQRLKGVVEKSYALQQACRTPLVATLACLANEGKELNAETRRGDLYAQVLRDLVRRAHRKDPLDANGPHVDDLLEMLQPMAWELFQASPAVNQFTNGEVKAAIEAGAKAAGLDQPVTTLRDELLADGVLVWAGLNDKNENQYSVLHRSFLEYLVVGHMAKAVKDQGWVNAKVQVQERKVPLHTVVDKKSWLADWQDVITLLAGKLDDAPPLIRLLKDEKTDDMFRHRLALAAHCLGELRDRRAYHELINEVTAEQWSFYWHHAIGHAVIDQVEWALPVLSELDGEIRSGQQLTTHLLALLRHPDSVMQFQAMFALKLTGPVARASVLDKLLELLRDCSPRVLAMIADTLRRLRPVSVRPEVVESLMELLRDPDPAKQRLAAGMIGCIEPAAARADVVDGLLQLLQSPSPGIQPIVVDALIRTGPGVVRPDVGDSLLRLLRDPNAGVRAEVVEALGRVGPRVPWPDVAERLLELLWDPDWHVALWAARALRRIGPLSAQLEAVERLLGMLSSGFEDEMRMAALVLGEMGPASAPENVTNRLVELLRDPHWEVRDCAALALGQLGPAAARGDVVDKLVELTRDSRADVRCRAASALGQIEPTAARGDVVDRMVELTRDSRTNVKLKAVQALGQMGPAATRGDVVDRLVALMLHPTADVQRSAAYALGEMGPVAARGNVVGRLAELMRDSDANLRRLAAYSLGLLGLPTEPAEVVDTLLEWLWDLESRLERWRCSAALEGIMRSGFRFFDDRTGSVRKTLVVSTAQLATL